MGIDRMNKNDFGAQNIRNKIAKCLGKGKIRRRHPEESECEDCEETDVRTVPRVVISRSFIRKEITLNFQG